MKNKVLSFVICIVFCAVIVFSDIFVACHAVHRCTGDGCAVCLEIEECVLLINSLSSSPAAAASVCVFVSGSITQLINVYCSSTDNITLVSLKVKLSE
ncbi:MAG: hypothetical protein Q4F95_10050 [Oscillospiraceae bacterium]|nr:hypothetical protein [Oscillospiraceae bacterium]